MKNNTNIEVRYNENGYFSINGHLLHVNHFINDSYKYRIDFENTFLKGFPKGTSCEITLEAEKKIEEIIEINRSC